MHSMLPSLRAEAGAAEFRGRPEFDEAFEALRASRKLSDARLLAVARDLERDQIGDSRRMLEKLLARQPENPDVLNLLADIADREGRHAEARRLLADCVQAAPDIEFYRYNYALALEKQHQSDLALAEAEVLLAHSPQNLLFRHLKALLLKNTEKYLEAVSCYRALASDYPNSAFIWNALGETLRDLGTCPQECTAAFLKAAELDPLRGCVWWNLANLGNFRFGEAHIAQMEAALSTPTFSPNNTAELHYGLGKANDSVKNYRRAFEHYSKANAIRRVNVAYDPDSTSETVSRTEAAFTPGMFRRNPEAGYPSREPIFVLGMQRSGSTLVEQILGNHSQVEALGELPLIIMLGERDLKEKFGIEYPRGMGSIAPDDLRALGEKYCDLASRKRRTAKPFFVDKCPYNFLYVGLIRLMLPNARIIDVRRHPMACCFANFTMNFQFGPPISYKQAEIGRFYADYVKLMAHFDRVQPGKICRVIYERLVADLETEVRRMLDYLELPFEQSCLEFFKSDRSFNSISSEQVRNPIFKEGVERWRNYEPWLGPLKSALGPVLDSWAETPEMHAISGA
jgi:tetratricopeptide (TPR) repeat protein